MREDNSPADLAKFIREYQPEILDRWAASVRRFPQLDRLSKPVLLDHMPAVIERIAESLEVEGDRPAPLNDYPERNHAKLRFQAGVDFRRLKAEYRVLREVVLRLWREQPRSADTDAVLRFTELLDEVIDTSHEHYLAARDEAVLASPGVPGPGLSTRELVLFSLERALEFAASARAAAVWLCVDEQLAFTAAAGEAISKVPDPAALEVVRKTCEMRLVRDAREQFHLLPILKGKHCLGVLVVKASQLSDEDHRLFRVVADHLGLALDLRALEEQSQERAQALLRMSAIIERGEPLVAVDHDWYVVRVNQPQEDISGIPRRKSLGRRLWDVFPAIPENVERACRRAMRECVPVSCETLYEPLHLWFDMAAYPTDEGGLVIFFHDITARKKAENALANAEHRYQLLVDSVQDCAILMADPQGKVASWNPGAQRLTGYMRNEVIGQPISIFYPEEERAAGTPERLLEQAVREKRAQAEGWRLRKDGSRYWAEVVFDIIPGPAETPAGYAIIVRDRTERKQREDSLAFLEEAGRTLAESLAFTETAERVAALAVPRLADWCIVDYIDDEHHTRPLAIMHVDPEKARWAHELRKRFPPDPDAARGVFHTIRTGQPEWIEEVSDEVLAAAAPNAEYLQILQSLGLRSIMILPLIARGRTRGTITLVAAESGRRYHKDDLLFAQQVAGRLALALDNTRLFDAAQRAVRLRGDMLAIVSHDLRSPLTATRLATALLTRRLKDDSLQKHVGTIQNAITQMDRLIEDLVDMVSIQSGKLRIEPQPCEITPLLRECVIQHQELVNNEGLILQARLDIPPEFRVSCDSQRLKQVMGNLLGNAIKFSEAGSSIELRASLESGAFRVEIADEGPGIPTDELPHLFDPYRSGLQHQGLGSGLGLYISQGIVEAHGGRSGLKAQWEKAVHSSLSYPERLLRKTHSEETPDINLPMSSVMPITHVHYRTRTRCGCPTLWKEDWRGPAVPGSGSGSLWSAPRWARHERGA